MTQRLAIARALSWTPDASFYERDPELGAKFTVELFSPSGHYCELSLDAVRVLTAFGNGKTAEQVRSQLAISSAEEPSFAALVGSLVERELLRPAEHQTESEPLLPPSFLVSAHGCGATLVRWIADSHPRVACAAPHRLGVVFQEMLRRSKQLGAFTAMDASPSVATEQLRTVLDELLRLHAKRRQKDSWLWSSRDHDRCLSFLDDLFLQKGRFVVVVRHPMDAAASSARKHDGEGWKAERMLEALRVHEDPHIAYAHYWVDVFARVRAFREDHPDRTLVVRYEDLVQRPKDETARLFGFLGLRAPERLHEEAFKKGHEVLWGGWESFALSKATTIVTDQVDLWRAWRPALRDRVQRVVDEEMRHWGYSLSL